MNRNESFDTLWDSIHQFPADLEAFFERIIRCVKLQYFEEMSQFSLITVEYGKPLPLFEYSLLKMERENPECAVQVPIRPIRDSDLLSEYPTMKSIMEN